MDRKEYAKLVEKSVKKSPSFKNCAIAFIVGGLICTLGEGLCQLYKAIGVAEDDAKTLCSVTLIFLGVLLTALHLYEKLAKYAGAGTLVPITGFANAMSAPAIEFRLEGMVTGLAAKMFVIAGPVLVYGISAATVYGVIYYFAK